MFIQEAQSKKSVGQTGLSLTLDSLADSEREKTDLHKTGQASTASVAQGKQQNPREWSGKAQTVVLPLASIQGHPEVQEGYFVPYTSHLPFSIYCDKFLPPSSVLLILSYYLSTKLGFIWNGLHPPIHFHTRPWCHAVGGSSVLLQANSLGQRNEYLMLGLPMACGPARRDQLPQRVE